MVTASGPLPLPANVGWVLFGNGAFLVSRLVVMAAIARLLGAEALGYFALGLAIAAPVFGLTNLGLRTTLATDVRSQFTFGEYWGVRLSTSVVGWVVVALLGLVLGREAGSMAIIALVPVPPGERSSRPPLRTWTFRYQALSRSGSCQKVTSRSVLAEG